MAQQLQGRRFSSPGDLVQIAIFKLLASVASILTITFE